MMVNHKLKYILLLFFLTILYTSCKSSKNKNEQDNLVFPQGKEENNNNFTGKVWLQMLVQSDSTLYTQIGNVTFEPKARTKWHYHKGGQILLVTRGVGYYQEKGKPKEVIKKGDVIKCPSNIVHWHGASSEDTMIHIAISPNLNDGGVVWLKSVSDEEYYQ